MRRRTRDWPLRVYRYRVYLRGHLPEAVWQHARRMQALWNDLVVLHDQERPGIEAHVCLRPPAAQRDDSSESIDAPRRCRCGGCQARREAWRALKDRWRVAAGASGLDWVSAPDVVDRMEATARSRRVPHAHHRLDRVTISHRFTAGGLPVARLGSPRSTRISIVPVPGHAYRDQSRQARRERVTDAQMTLGGVLVLFRVRLHRRMPLDAVVKRVAFCGRMDPLRRWAWHLHVTVEEPPTARNEATRIAALDVGWRRFPDYVRIGMLWDGHEMIEFRLPLDAPTAHSRRHHLAASYPGLGDHDQIMGKALDEVKAILLGYGTPLGFALMRQGGLVRWLRALETDPTVPVDDPRLAILRAWRSANDRARSRKQALWARLVGRRRWYYENLAAWLGRTYAAVVWEQPLGIKAMAEAAPESSAISTAGRYRQWAAIGELRRLIAAKMRTLPGRTADSTRACHQCGALTEPGPARVLSCPAGHVWDQDENAARNLYSQIAELLGRDEALRASGVVAPTESVVIPSELRAVAVQVHPG